MKSRLCKQCKKPFVKKQPLQYVCNPQCAINYANALKVKREQAERKQERKEARAGLEKIKKLSEYLHDAQRWFNLYIRLRDQACPCISCGRFHTGQYHAGHYRTIGSAPNLRFDESNVHKQCAPCNNHLSGNIVAYRNKLSTKIGLRELERIECDNTAKNYTIDDAKMIKSTYKQKVKELKEKYA